MAVEMEAAALYAFSETRGTDVVCLAHVTNTMAVHGDDFDKGADDGVESSLAVVQAVVERVLGAGCRDSYGYSL